MWAGADLRGTKPAPNGIDFPGRCTQDLGLLGNSAISPTNAVHILAWISPMKLELWPGASALQASLNAPLPHMITSLCHRPTEVHTYVRIVDWPSPLEQRYVHMLRGVCPARLALRSSTILDVQE